MFNSFTPPNSDVAALLDELRQGVRTVLGDHFVGLYLDGSLTSGDFDLHSDIDFVVVTDVAVSADQFAALQAMHDRIAMLDSAWASQLEGSYLSQDALRRHDPSNALHPNLQRDKGQRLKPAEHDHAWNVHRYILRERGITLAGPAVETLVDPVSPEQLRAAALEVLHQWAARIPDDPALIRRRGYQSYIVLSLCRILYTFAHGTVVSKPFAARWADEALDARWIPLIECAWAGRQTPDALASPEDVSETIEFMRYALECSPQVNVA